MYMRFKDGKKSALTLSYDDGVVFDSGLIKIMDKYGLKGTFNISGGLFKDENTNSTSTRMTLQEAKSLYINSGHEVAIHGYTHPYLDRLDNSEIVSEITEDRRSLEKEFGCIVKGMAYPYGTYDDRVIRILNDCGICYSRTVEATKCFNLPSNWLKWHPTCHHNNPELMELARCFVENDNTMRTSTQVFYLWGHSYEFNNDNNWGVIEKFAEYMGGRENIWYATNIEIYDYVTAYRSLKTSYDKKIIYNPAAIDIWVELDGEVLKIKSGETVYRGENYA